MATTVSPFPIYYTQDVHGFYLKQKNEFHFHQKSDNDFLMFLLDTAVRVISIVQHLAPVIEAVSDASGDDVEDLSPGTPNSNINMLVNTMDVDNIAALDNIGAAPSPQPHLPPLSAELEQINQEITAAQISGSKPVHQIHQPISQLHTSQSYTAPSHSTQTRDLSMTTRDLTMSTRDLTMTTRDLTMTTRDITAPIEIGDEDVPVMQTVAQPSAPLTTTSVPSHTNYTATPSESNTVSCSPAARPASNVPPVQLPSSAEPSEYMSTSQPHEEGRGQPVAQGTEGAATESTDVVKTELPVPEVIEIKEEIAELAIPASSSSSLLSPGTLQQLMSSISTNEENVGLQNFVTTATPSNLPPTFLDRSSTNPLSMLGSLNSGETPGPSGLNIPNISESMMKNINDAGLNVASIKGQANPTGSGPRWTKYSMVCEECGKACPSKWHLVRHREAVHLKLKKYKCEHCRALFYYHDKFLKHTMQCAMKLNQYFQY